MTPLYLEPQPVRDRTDGWILLPLIIQGPLTARQAIQFPRPEVAK